MPSLPVLLSCRPSDRLIHPTPAAAGLACFAVGFLFYAIARPPTVALMPSMPWLAVYLPPQAMTGSLPSFLHVLALCLLSASVSAPSRRSMRAVCLAWALGAIALELGQLEGVAAWLAGGAWPAALGTGRFDPWDVAAVVLGAAMAYAWLTPHFPLFPRGQS
ncbi:MAG: hypothetical protein AAF184_24595 [Pseudomonadota bacterium]